MALTTATDTWSEGVTLAKPQIWQVHKGRAQFTTAATPDPDDGLLLAAGQAYEFAAGMTVRHRAADGTTALFYRMEIAP